MAMEHLKRRLPSIGLEKLTLLVELLESRGFLRSYLGDGQIFWERVVRRPRH